MSSITVCLVLCLLNLRVKSMELSTSTGAQLPDPRDNYVEVESLTLNSLDEGLRRHAKGRTSLKSIFQALLRFKAMGEYNSNMAPPPEVQVAAPDEDIQLSSSQAVDGRVSYSSTSSLLAVNSVGLGAVRNRVYDFSAPLATGHVVAVEDEPYDSFTTAQLEKDKSHKFTHSFRFGYGAPH